MVAFTVDGFHDGERRSTYSAANFVNVGPEAGRGTGLPPPFSRAWSAFTASGLPSVTRRGAAEAEHPGHAG